MLYMCSSCGNKLVTWPCYMLCAPLAAGPSNRVMPLGNTQWIQTGQHIGAKANQACTSVQRMGIAFRLKISADPAFKRLHLRSSK